MDDTQRLFQNMPYIGTNLNCSVTEAQWCKQIAYYHYTAMPQSQTRDPVIASPTLDTVFDVNQGTTYLLTSFLSSSTE